MHVKYVTVVAAIAAAEIARGQYGPVPQQPNAPFSADMITAQVQTLADGTHISQPEQTTKLYRDSLGRTRTESFFKPSSSLQSQPSPKDVTIVDPVEGARYILDVNKKTARRIVFPKQTMPSVLPPAVAQALAGQPPGTTVQLTPAGVRYISNQHPLGIGVPDAPPSRTESLGRQTIEGLVAEGHRTTTTYAVGTIGNDREVVSTHESWQSPEFGMMLVLSKDSDPRTGERTTKVINVSRTEPDPALFVIPSDYTIEEQPGEPAAGQNAR